MFSSLTPNIRPQLSEIQAHLRNTTYTMSANTASSPQSNHLPTACGPGTNLLSFLHLPGELRNRIYDHLFVHDECINVPHADMLDAPKAPIPGINLLSSCREIHSEAAGILYAQNKFTVSGHSLNCSRGLHISQIGSWLASIGRFAGFVSTISVDLATSCPGGDILWPHYLSRVDISLILEHIERRPAHNRAITFHADTGKAVPQSSNSLSAIGIATNALNTLLRQLDGNGTSVLDTCLRLRRSCHSIHCSGNGFSISFELSDQPPPIRFYRTQEGTYELDVSPPVPQGIYSLAVYNILNKIFGPAPEKIQNFFFNINDGSVSPSLPATLHVSTQFRDWTLRHGRYKFIARCSIHNQAVSPRVFENLETWVTDGRPMSFPGLTQPWFHGSGSDMVLLHIQSSAGNVNSMTCFDALSFLWSTLSLSDLTPIGILCGSTSVIDYDSVPAVATLHCLRRRVLHFLEFLANLPWHLRTRFAPVIWMDEQCRVQFATFKSNRRGLITIKNEDPDWQPPELLTWEAGRRHGKWSHDRIQRQRKHREQGKLTLNGQEIREQRLRKTLGGTRRLLREFLWEVYGDS